LATYISSVREASSNKYFPSSKDKNSKRSAFSNKWDKDMAQNYIAFFGDSSDSLNIGFLIILLSSAIYLPFRLI
jgi:hypothetical protein